MDKGLEYNSSPKRYTNGQQAYKKMLNITSHQRDTNHNLSEVLPHRQQYGHYQKDEKQQGLEKT